MDYRPFHGMQVFDALCHTVRYLCDLLRREPSPELASLIDELMKSLGEVLHDDIKFFLFLEMSDILDDVGMMKRLEEVDLGLHSLEQRRGHVDSIHNLDRHVIFFQSRFR